MSSRLEISDITVSDNSFSVDGKRFAKGALALDVRPGDENVGFITADTLEYVTLPKPYSLYSGAKDEVFATLKALTDFFDANLVPDIHGGGSGITITSSKVMADGTGATLSIPAGKTLLSISAATSSESYTLNIGTTLDGSDVATKVVSSSYPAYEAIEVYPRTFSETDATTLYIGNPDAANIVLRIVFTS